MPLLPSLGSKSNIIDALFELEFEETMSNKEASDEAVIKKVKSYFYHESLGYSVVKFINVFLSVPCSVHYEGHYGT